MTSYSPSATATFVCFLPSEVSPKMISIYYLDFSTLPAQLSSLPLVHEASLQLSSSESLATVLLSNNALNLKPTSQEHLTQMTHSSFCENSPLGLFDLTLC